MAAKRYFVLVAVVTVVWVVALLAVPPFALLIEQLMLGFLASTAG